MSLAHVADIVLFHVDDGTPVFCAAGMAGASVRVGASRFGGSMRLSDTCSLRFENHPVPTDHYIEIPAASTLQCIARYQRSWFHLLLGEAHLARIEHLHARWNLPLPPELREASGLAVSRTQPGVLWANNDSGDAPMIYAIDQKGRLLAKVAVADAEATDWEDIAIGPCPEDGATTHCLYIADTGDNNRKRADVTIFIVDEPSIAGADPSRPMSVKARSFRFRYPTEPEDTEAIAVLPNGDVTVVTKGRTPTIDFLGFAKADIVRALTSKEILTARPEGNSGILPDQGLGRWVTSGVTGPRRLVIMDPATWAHFWSELGAGVRPQVDFGNDLVIAVASGERSTGGHDIEVRRVTRVGNELQIEVLETDPSEGCITTQAKTQPVDVVMVAGTGVTGWSFFDSRAVGPC